MVRSSSMLSIRHLKAANTVSSNGFCFESKLLSEVGKMLCKTRRKLLYAQQWENNFLTVYENMGLIGLVGFWKYDCSWENPFIISFFKLGSRFYTKHLIICWSLSSSLFSLFSNYEVGNGLSATAESSQRFASLKNCHWIKLVSHNTLWSHGFKHVYFRTNSCW